MTMARTLRVMRFIRDAALPFVLVDETAIVIQTIFGEDFAAVRVIMEKRHQRKSAPVVDDDVGVGSALLDVCG